MENYEVAKFVQISMRRSPNRVCPARRFNPLESTPVDMYILS